MIPGYAPIAMWKTSSPWNGTTGVAGIVVRSMRDILAGTVTHITSFRKRPMDSTAPSAVNITTNNLTTITRDKREEAPEGASFLNNKLISIQ